MQFVIVLDSPSLYVTVNDVGLVQLQVLALNFVLIVSRFRLASNVLSIVVKFRLVILSDSLFRLLLLDYHKFHQGI